MKLEGVIHRHASRFQLGPISVEGPDDRPWVIVGPPGSGKSTLLKIMAGALKPDVGEVQQFPERVAYLPQLAERAFAGGALVQELEYPTAANPDTVRADLAEVGLAHIPPGRSVRHLSAGEKRRAALLMLRRLGYQRWALDEPDAALDAKGQRDLLALLKKDRSRVKSLWIATHNPWVYRSLDPFILWVSEGFLRAANPQKELFERGEVRDHLCRDRDHAQKLWELLAFSFPDLPPNVWKTLSKKEGPIAQIHVLLKDRAGIP